MEMLQLTCRNHPKAVYLTKGDGHSLFFVEADPDYVRSLGAEFADLSDETIQAVSRPSWECLCPASDLVEVDE